MAKEYYANKYGIQLEEFLIWGSEWDLKFWQYNFTTSQGFALTNALKYVVRAGKKPDEPYENGLYTRGGGRLGSTSKINLWGVQRKKGGTWRT